MQLPDEIIDVGITVRLHGEVAGRSTGEARACESRLARVLPRHVRLTRTPPHYLLEWTPPIPCRRGRDEPEHVFKARIGDLLRDAVQEVRDCLSRLPAEEGQWVVATLEGTEEVDAYVRGRLAGGQEVFLAHGPP